jgi:regulatory protein
MSKTQSKRTDPYYQAQDILSRRDHSAHEVRGKLLKKGFSPEQVTTVLQWLHDKKLVNDKQFAQRYIDSILRGKAVGRRWLKHKLKEKGVASDIIEHALAAAFEGDREQELAAAAADTWRRSHPRHATDRARLTRHLLSRGFSFATVQEIVPRA